MPPLTIFMNPGRGRSRRSKNGERAARARGTLVSQRAREIWYTHIDDGQLYRHDFAAGVSIEFLPDGSARLFRPDGKPLWKDF